MIPETLSAFDRVVEVVMFENWLRFYFLAEEGEKLFLRLPEKAMAQLKNRYAEFYGLAEYLQDTEISHEASVKAVCLFVSDGPGAIALPESRVAEVFDSSRFHLELQLFGSWVQGHEEQLDERFLEFSQWRELYARWKDTDEVRAYAQAQAQEKGIAQRPTARAPAGDNGDGP
jgi:hypothetical protein